MPDQGDSHVTVSGARRRTSPKGRGFLKRHEGEVLKAYRDPVGVLTIGSGLTRASGVVDPKPGMVITASESDRLLQLALERNYEPAVIAAMPGATQQDFDGAISFHFNTGAIGRASWVKSWRAGDWVQVKARLALWKKGGGRVLPGLVRRRAEEYGVMRYGAYLPVDARAPLDGYSRVAVPMTDAERAAANAAFRKLGYSVGSDPRQFLAAGIRDFQRDHDLTVDGIVGRATLSTLQRRLDAATKTSGGAVVAGAGGAGAGSGELSDALGAVPWAGTVVLGLAIVFLLWTVWRYRDVVAAKVQRRLPTLAAKLRSI